MIDRYALVKMYHPNCLQGNVDRIIDTYDHISDALDRLEEEVELHCYVDDYEKGESSVDLGDYNLCVFDALDQRNLCLDEEDERRSPVLTDFGIGEWEVLHANANRWNLRIVVFRVRKMKR